LSEAENRDVFGKCNWKNGHGHNYGLEVTLSGDPDPHTGLLFDPAAVDRAVQEEVLARFDHRNLNVDVPEFEQINPTSENLTRLIWEKLDCRFASDPRMRARLHRVAVRETARNYFEYFGPANTVLERSPQ
jgi:6-pyruvoyltetrahydropterin/6-carboxytetrahydropterin synthase